MKLSLSTIEESVVPKHVVLYRLTSVGVDVEVVGVDEISLNKVVNPVLAEDAASVHKL